MITQELLEDDHPGGPGPARSHLKLLLTNTNTHSGLPKRINKTTSMLYVSTGITHGYCSPVVNCFVHSLVLPVTCVTEFNCFVLQYSSVCCPGNLALDCCNAAASRINKVPTTMTGRPSEAALVPGGGCPAPQDN